MGRNKKLPVFRMLRDKFYSNIKTDKNYELIFFIISKKVVDRENISMLIIWSKIKFFNVFVYIFTLIFYYYTIFVFALNVN